MSRFNMSNEAKAKGKGYREWLLKNKQRFTLIPSTLGTSGHRPSRNARPSDKDNRPVDSVRGTIRGTIAGSS